MKLLKTSLFIVLLCMVQQGLLAQSIYLEKQYQFVAYEKIPAWTGVISNWTDANKAGRKVHLYDTKKYKGHAEFVSKGLNKGITFAQFKEQVRYPAKRQYMPFFLYDLRDKPLVLDNKTYTWAVRLEDYQYQDDAKGLEDLTLQMMNTMYSYLQSQQKDIGKGIIILATNKEVKPNTSVKSVLNKAGYPNLTITEMINNYGAAKANTTTTVTNTTNPKSTNNAPLAANTVAVSILNSGTAIGYLQYVEAKNADKTGSNYQQILLYEKMPYRVPIAGGILTLEPQTTLSHINLLAKNRKTINAYLSNEKDVAKLKPYFGKLVKIQTNDKTKTIAIQEVSLEEAKTYWNSKPSLKISIPKINWETQFISYFDIGSKAVQTVNSIGTKASNYALLQAKFPEYVRKGFGVPFHFYKETIELCGADKLIEAFLKDHKTMTDAQRKTQLKAIRDKITQGKVPTMLLNQIKNLGEEHYKGKRLRLRSSTNCEDLPQFNGAGLYESKGFNFGTTPKKLDTLQSKILDVYASLWLDRAYEEREFFQIPHEQVGMAILINEAFSKEYANGVAITMSNGKGGKSIYINTQAGENAVTNPEAGQVAESIVFENMDSKWYVVERKSNLKNVFVDNGDLTKLVRDLQTLITQVDALLNPKNNKDLGVDIEFKIMKEKDGYKLYIKQARLLSTTLPE